MNFLLCIAQYLLILLGIAAIGTVGGAIGITLRKRKNAKEMAEAANIQDRN